jgi:hypothetical protein
MLHIGQRDIDAKGGCFLLGMNIITQQTSILSTAVPLMKYGCSYQMSVVEGLSGYLLQRLKRYFRRGGGHIVLVVQQHGASASMTKLRIGMPLISKTRPLNIKRKV